MHTYLLKRAHGHEVIAIILSGKLHFAPHRFEVAAAVLNERKILFVGWGIVCDDYQYDGDVK